MATTHTDLQSLHHAPRLRANAESSAQAETMSREPPHPLSIRAAVPSDAEDVTRIYVVSWNAGFGHLMGYRSIEPKLIARWRRDIGSSPPQRWWVAKLDGETVRFAGIGPCRDPTDPSLGELDTIAVAPAYWRPGVGEALMTHCLHFLSKDGYKEAVLWTLENYPRGAGFYAATGWLRNGRVRDGGKQISYSHPLAPQ